eukprot:GILK01002070.1.p1 GENE.GILK01002070.1~~GILK01002070.1.p1  ORF type:complete len:432 (+),score=48.55 GILK01002070.1:36-1298(+)
MDTVTPTVKYLRSLPSIRERCGEILALAKQDALPNFSLDMSKLNDVVDFVLAVMHKNYPDSRENPSCVPFHSRFRHLEVGGSLRPSSLRSVGSPCDDLEFSRRLLDLTVVSVLLDAGAGPTWKYFEAATNAEFNRSEGLAVASFDMFKDGAFSSDVAQPHQADAEGLKRLTDEHIIKGFQVSDTNPLVGVSGRSSLLQRLGAAIERKPQYFGSKTGAPARPGNLIDYLLTQADENKTLSVHSLWEAVIYGLEEIWPATRTVLDGTNMGDVWVHPSLPNDAPGRNLVPFHKLSQWLTYSLMEVLIGAGFQIVGISEMTGLPEYRNGGLLLDMGLLVPKRDDILSSPHTPDSSVIVEWRALTVCMLDAIGESIQKRYGQDASQLPLVKILEGGTWAAGRVVAKSKRADGGPPLNIVSDGTVF